jgi:hypothetical protein
MGCKIWGSVPVAGKLFVSPKLPNQPWVHTVFFSVISGHFFARVKERFNGNHSPPCSEFTLEQDMDAHTRSIAVVIQFL